MLILEVLTWIACVILQALISLFLPVREPPVEEANPADAAPDEDPQLVAAAPDSARTSEETAVVGEASVQNEDDGGGSNADDSRALLDEKVPTPLAPVAADADASAAVAKGPPAAESNSVMLTDSLSEELEEDEALDEVLHSIINANIIAKVCRVSMPPTNQSSDEESKVCLQSHGDMDSFASTCSATAAEADHHFYFSMLDDEMRESLDGDEPPEFFAMLSQTGTQMLTVRRPLFLMSLPNPSSHLSLSLPELSIFRGDCARANRCYCRLNCCHLSSLCATRKCRTGPDAIASPTRRQLAYSIAVGMLELGFRRAMWERPPPRKLVYILRLCYHFRFPLLSAL
jgi:hypothetical protein